MTRDDAAWDHVAAVTRPALALAAPDFLDEIAARLAEAGRERWVTTGAGLITVDTLVHNMLHRTGTL